MTRTCSHSLISLIDDDSESDGRPWTAFECSSSSSSSRASLLTPKNQSVRVASFLSGQLISEIEGYIDGYGKSVSSSAGRRMLDSGRFIPRVYELLKSGQQSEVRSHQVLTRQSCQAGYGRNASEVSMSTW